jgi:hypothetical protein
VGLAELRQVGQHAQTVGTAVVDEIDIQDVVAAFAQVGDDPAPGLAAAAGDDDPHDAEPSLA